VGGLLSFNSFQSVGTERAIIWAVITLVLAAIALGTSSLVYHTYILVLASWNWGYTKVLEGSAKIITYGGAFEGVRTQYTGFVQTTEGDMFPETHVAWSRVDALAGALAEAVHEGHGVGGVIAAADELAREIGGNIDVNALVKAAGDAAVAIGATHEATVDAALAVVGWVGAHKVYEPPTSPTGGVHRFGGPLQRIRRVHAYSFFWGGMNEEGNRIFGEEKILDYVPLEDRVYSVQVEECVDADGFPMVVEALFTMRVKNPQKATFRTDDWVSTAISRMTPSVRGFVGGKTEEELRTSRSVLKAGLMADLTKTGLLMELDRDYGVDVPVAELLQVHVREDYRDQIPAAVEVKKRTDEIAAEAARNVAIAAGEGVREAAIAVAQGEAEAIRLRGQAEKDAAIAAAEARTTEISKIVEGLVEEGGVVTQDTREKGLAAYIKVKEVDAHTASGNTTYFASPEQTPPVRPVIRPGGDPEVDVEVTRDT